MAKLKFVLPWKSKQICVAQSIQIGKQFEIGKLIISIAESIEMNTAIDFYADQKGLINILSYGDKRIHIAIRTDEFFEAIDTLRASIKFEEGDK